MSASSLQGGRRRRRAKGWLAGIVVVALAAVGAGALLLTASGGASRGGLRSDWAATAATPVNGPASAGAPLTPYASALAPSRRRVDPHFRRPPRAGLMWDLDSGRVLWRIRPEARVPIASLTKMMTALIAVEALRPGARVMITRAAVSRSGSKVGLLPRGRRVRAETLLYGLLLPSGNDAAIALAQRVAGSVARFVGRMNARAREMGSAARASPLRTGLRTGATTPARATSRCSRARCCATRASRGSSRPDAPRSHCRSRAAGSGSTTTTR